MNILPKKKWHVRTKENIERVRVDEENARLQEEEKLRKIALAESEARTDVLRQKSRKRVKGCEDYAAPVGLQHINFFKAEEEGDKKSGTNADYEAEKKQEKEKQEKAIGLLTYLGQSAVESQKEKPWYFEPPNKKRKPDTAVENVSKGTVKTWDEFDTKRKMSQDPMNQMTKYVSMDQKYHDHMKAVQRKSGQATSLLTPQLDGQDSSSVTSKSKTIAHILEHKKHKKKQKKEKKDKKKKDKKKDHKHKHRKLKHLKTEISLNPESIKEIVVHKNNTTVTTSGKSIAELRAERLKRERSEKRKTESVLAKARGEIVPPPKEENVDERSHRYNSQFNPKLARGRPKPAEIVIPV